GAHAPLRHRRAVDAEEPPPRARAAGVDAEDRGGHGAAGTSLARPRAARTSSATAGGRRSETTSRGRNAPGGPRRTAVSQPAATSASNADARPTPRPAPALTA